MSVIGECWHCGKQTHFVDLDFETFLHPGVCQDAQIMEWIRASKLYHRDGDDPTEVPETP